MIGAITTLIAIVAVFLAYNANNGLPFVPVYSVSVDIPNGVRLGANNEVRIGGTRIGVVGSIEAIASEDSQLTADTTERPGELPTVAARINLKLDKVAEPLPKNSIFRVRYRSAFGLKYVEIVRGEGDPAPEGHIFNGLDDSGSCELPVDGDGFAASLDQPASNGCFQDQNEFDSINNTFDNKTRQANRDNLVGFGGGFAARGVSLNETFQALEPLFVHLKPVAEAINARSTRFDRLFPALARTSRIVAPVAAEQADQFEFGARTFAAITRDEEAFKATISEGPATLQTAIRLLPAQRRFASEFADVSRELNPGVADLRVALPDLNDAIEVGAPVLERSPRVNRLLKGVFRELDQLVRQPSTKITLERLEDTFDHAKPLFRYVAPAQTVCNYWNYWFTYFSNALSDEDAGLGNAFRQILLRYPSGESSLTGYSGIGANGRAGATPNPADNGKFKPYEIPITNTHPYRPTGQRNADCQGGQEGYPLGKITVPGQLASDPANRISDLPGSRGPTTLFWNADLERESIDTRRASRQPGTWRGVGRR
jgi:ABC-type transporter Mla subunit MlaD